LSEERIERRLTAILAADVVGYSIHLGRHPRLTAALVSDAVLDAAFARVYRRRRHWPADADVWSFRRGWPDEKQRPKEALLSGRFRFGLLLRVSAALIFSDTTLPPTVSPSRCAPWPTSPTGQPGFMSKSESGRKAPPGSGPMSSDGMPGRAAGSTRFGQPSRALWSIGLWTGQDLTG
jgi:hypothetical protein